MENILQPAQQDSKPHQGRESRFERRRARRHPYSPSYAACHAHQKMLLRRCRLLEVNVGGRALKYRSARFAQDGHAPREQHTMQILRSLGIWDANQRCWTVTISQAKLARLLGVQERTAARILDRLILKNSMECIERNCLHTHKARTYKIFRDEDIVATRKERGLIRLVCNRGRSFITAAGEFIKLHRPQLPPIPEFVVKAMRYVRKIFVEPAPHQLDEDVIDIAKLENEAFLEHEARARERAHRGTLRERAAKFRETHGC